MSTASPRHDQRRVSALVAVLCLVIQVAGVLHLFLTRHAVCPTHGDVMEVGGHAPGDPHASDDGEQTALDVDHAAVDGHDDHCAWLTLPRDHRVAAPLAARLDLATVAPTTATPTTLPRAATALYRLAPKLSPPALA